MVSWNTVESSNIAMVGYDLASMELHVKFNSGAEYLYRDVPEAVFDELMAAPSKGRFLNERIKGQYEYERV